MTNSQLTDLRTLILSEVGDFFAVVGSPGEPETPEEMQRELSMRLGRILNNHIVNYPRCEVLVEILRECRKARDEAQAGLQERRKAAMDSEPDAYIFKHPSGKLFWVLTDESNKGRRDVMPAYASPQPAPVVPVEMNSDKAWGELKISAEDCQAWSEGWNACRAAMLAAAPQEVGDA